MAKWIRSFLTQRDYGSDPEGDQPWICVETDPFHKIAYVVGEDRNPLRLRSPTTVRVPMHSWTKEEENDLIFRVMNEAAKENLRRVKSYAEITPAFLAKASFNLCVLVANPAAEGRFPVPRKTEVFYSEEVPIEHLVGLGPPGQAGVYLSREKERGFIANRLTGLQSMLIFDPR